MTASSPHGIGGAKDLPIPPSSPSRAPCAALVVSFTVLALAWRDAALRRATRSGRAGPGAGSRAIVDGAVVRGRCCGSLGFAVLPVRRRGRGLRRGPADQPVLRDRSTCCSGSASCRLRCSSARSTRRSARCARSTRLLARLSGGDPDVGLRDVPRPARLLAGRARAVRVRVARAGLPVQHRARSGPPVVRGVRRGDADRRRACSATGSTSTPTRSRSTPPWSRQLSLWGRDDDGQPRRTQPAREPGPHPGAARACWRCCSVLFGSTAFDSFKDSGFWVRFDPVVGRRRAPSG